MGDLFIHEKEKAMGKTLVSRCRKCGHHFGDEHNIITIDEWGLCCVCNRDNDMREKLMGDILVDQNAEAQAEMEA